MGEGKDYIIIRLSSYNGGIQQWSSWNFQQVITHLNFIKLANCQNSMKFYIPIHLEVYNHIPKSCTHLSHRECELSMFIAMLYSVYFQWNSASIWLKKQKILHPPETTKNLCWYESEGGYKKRLTLPYIQKPTTNEPYKHRYSPDTIPDQQTLEILTVFTCKLYPWFSNHAILLWHLYFRSSSEHTVTRFSVNLCFPHVHYYINKQASEKSYLSVKYNQWIINQISLRNWNDLPTASNNLEWFPRADNIG